MNGDGHKPLLVACLRILVVVGLVSNGCRFLGRLYTFIVYDSAVLGQLQVNFIAVNVDRLYGKLIALFQLQGIIGCDGHISVIIDQDLQKLSFGQSAFIRGLLEDEVLIRVCALQIASKALLPQEAYDGIGPPVLELKGLLLGGGLIDKSIGSTPAEFAIAQGRSELFSAHIAIEIVAEASEVLRIPGEVAGGHLAVENYDFMVFVYALEIASQPKDGKYDCQGDQDAC
ncbi:Uncharacterised protein [uncultured archaeon]|nr:Uncharacterised protein [uncultured archaeon]